MKSANMLGTLFIVLWLNFISNSMSSFMVQSSLYRQCTHINTSQFILVCSNFKSFDELHFECQADNDDSHNLHRLNDKYTRVSLAPKTPRVFDFSLAYSDNTIIDSYHVDILLYHLTGVELFTSQFFLHNHSSKTLEFIDRVFEIYAHGTLLSAKHPILVRNQSLTIGSTFFSTRFKELAFRTSVVFKTPIHPLAFKDMYVHSFLVYGLVDSFLRVNLMTFMATPELNIGIINPYNTTIEYLDLFVHEVHIDTRLLNLHVHNRLGVLRVYGKFLEVMPDMFRLLPMLRSFRVEVPLLRSFIQRTNWEWLRVLDSMSQEIRKIIMLDEIKNYDFTSNMNHGVGIEQKIIQDADFCLFAGFNLSNNTFLQVFFLFFFLHFSSIETNVKF